MSPIIKLNQSNLANLTDEELVKEYLAQGKTYYFDELYSRTAHLVLGVCMKYCGDASLAEDATQQIFIKVVNDLPRFTITNFRGWLHQVSKNYCLMEVRKGSKVVYTDTVADYGVESHQNAHHKEDFEIQLKQLEDALGELNDEQQLCIRLFYLEKKSYIEISNQTGLTLLKVKSAIQNGKRNLKNMLTKERLM